MQIFGYILSNSVAVMSLMNKTSLLFLNPEAEFICTGAAKIHSDWFTTALVTKNAATRVYILIFPKTSLLLVVFITLISTTAKKCQETEVHFYRQRLSGLLLWPLN